MCGLTYIRAEVTAVNRKTLLDYITKLIDLSLRRGSDALGIIIFSSDCKYELKRSDIKKGIWNKFLANVFAKPELLGHQITIVAHTRMATNGSTSDTNIQPISRGSLTLAHNGILINEGWFDTELMKDGNQKDFGDWSDTRKALHSVSLGAGGKSFDNEMECLFSKFDGANNAILHSQENNRSYFFTTHGSLFFCQKDGLFVCGSEQIFLESVIGITAEKYLKNSLYVLDDFILTPISGALDTQQLEKVGTTPPPYKTDFSKFSNKLRDNTALIESIGRCSKCLMTVTTPFIHIDDSGECIYCRQESAEDWRPKEKLSILKDKLSKHDRILFPFSGGRDSSFGLLKLREIYDGEIIAYTYDWGMVTDLARRNISSLCGQFGIEHVLISADLDKKLSNVRKNISAWLKAPNLGLVPLFMAGDKQYFYYINKLMSERNIGLSFLCSNPFERTNFKTGFCGIDVNKSQNQKYFSLNNLDKFKMIGFYAEKFIKNPRYLNMSLVDTAGAFLSYYGIEHNYEGFFDYYQWREDEVEQALKTKLRWEFSSDTQSSWRIGDGTAPFYNYIYLNMAGFTENDALRSNQVRAGHISREDAFELLKRDNENRAESLYWYFDRLGLDPLLTIDAFHSKLDAY